MLFDETSHPIEIEDPESSSGLQSWYMCYNLPFEPI